MRIFYASGETPNGALSHSSVWRTNLYQPLVDLGHEVIEFKYDLEPLIAHADIANPEHIKFINQHRPQAECELLRQIVAAHNERPIDLFFSYFSSSCVTAETILAIREMGIQTVNWYCNGSYQLHLVADIAPAYNYCLVPEKFRLEDYRRLGANPIYCQEAANPNIYRPYDLPREFDVVFVGARYADRPVYLRRLLDAGINVRVFGPGWQRGLRTAAVGSEAKRNLRSLLTMRGWRRLVRVFKRRLLPLPPTEVAPHEIELPDKVCGPPLSDNEMIKMYSRAKICLGFSTVGNTHTQHERITQVRLRDFEAPMSGAFYMVEHMSELEEFYEIGKELVCYTDPDDLVEKCRYYLTHDAERERIRLAGHSRAVNDHSWHRRFEMVFDHIAIPMR